MTPNFLAWATGEDSGVITERGNTKYKLSLSSRTEDGIKNSV